MKVFHGSTLPSGVIGLRGSNNISTTGYVLIFYKTLTDMHPQYNQMICGASPFWIPALVFSNDIYGGRINQFSLHQ